MPRCSSACYRRSSTAQFAARHNIAANVAAERSSVAQIAARRSGAAEVAPRHGDKALFAAAVRRHVVAHRVSRRRSAQMTTISDLNILRIRYK